jgi:RNA polymerase sigma-70 factor (ECF subfamily)
MTRFLIHLDAAYNLARWLMRNEHDAEDAVQKAYLKAFRRLSGFRGGDGRAWLLAIVRDSCYERLQHRGLRDQSAFDDGIHSVGRSTINPETSLLEKENAELLREALAALSPEYREVLVLRELEELSYLEIASITTIPLGTVMSRLSRARKRLQLSLLNLAAGRNPAQPSIALDGSVATLMGARDRAK